MSSLTVRISDTAHKTLRRLSGQTGEPMQKLLDKMIEEYRRKHFFEAANASYAALREDPKQWAEVEKERKAWDATLMDGLDPEEAWDEEGRTRRPKKRGKNRD